MVQLDMMRRVAAHAWLDFPPMRGLSDGDSHAGCPQCGNGDGVCGDGGQWGDSDKLGYVKGPLTDLTAGEIVEFVVKLTAHHKGHFEFGICRELLNHDTQNPQDCVDQVKLERVPPPDDCVPNDDRSDCQPMHEDQKVRWYLPPGPDTDTLVMHFQIPENFECKACTLQWRWWTGNSCAPFPDYGCYYQKMRELGWNADEWCGEFCGTCDEESTAMQAQTPTCNGEEFKNCADISVTKGTSGPTPAPAPTTPAPTTPAPPTSTAAPTSVPPLGSCIRNSNCDENAWCKDETYHVWCEQNQKDCPDPQCRRA